MDEGPVGVGGDEGTALGGDPASTATKAWSGVITSMASVPTDSAREA